MLLLTSRRRLRVRPLRAEDACPRVRKLGDEDRQLRGRRRTKERTDGGPRAAGRGARANEGGRWREGGERRARPRAPCGLELAPVAAPRTRAHSQFVHDCSRAQPRPKSKTLNQSSQPRGASRETRGYKRPSCYFILTESLIF